MDPLHQEERLQRFCSLTQGPWTVIADSWHNEDSNGGIYCALANQEYRDEALSQASWDITKSCGGPGFMKSYGGGEPTTTYVGSGANDDGVEYLVRYREFHGARPDYIELDQDFRLFHNLVPTDAGFDRFLDDGSHEEAVRLSETRVEVRTPLLLRYIAARQVDLILFIDSVQFDPAAVEIPGPRALRDSFTNIELHASDGRELLLGKGPFSRMLGKMVVPPGPVESCGMWPFEPDENYPTYVIGEDSQGGPVLCTCEPDKLANYFGANPDAPNYLTPVFFRRTVLKKYYEEPSLYEVQDGYLSCGSLWGVRIDNDLPDRVAVFLGDLGRDLPSAERDYWRGFMIPPTGPSSHTNIRRSFYNQPTWPQSPEFGFKRAWRDLNTAWEQEVGWPLFIDPGGDLHLQLKQLRIPLDESTPEFETGIRLMALLLIDRLNERKLAQFLDPKKERRGISKLQDFLAKFNSPQDGELSEFVTLLRSLQEVRSKVVAHIRSSSTETVLSANLGSLRGSQAVADLLERATVGLSVLKSWVEDGADAIAADSSS